MYRLVIAIVLSLASFGGAVSLSPASFEGDSWTASETTPKNPAIITRTLSDGSIEAIHLAHVFLPHGLAQDWQPNVAQSISAFLQDGATRLNQKGTDRYGRPFADFRNAAGISLTHDLVAHGNMLVLPQSKAPQSLWDAQKKAQAEKRGVWQKAALQVTAWSKTSLYEGQFHALKGRVESVGERRKRLYLNFGRRWRDDLTIVAPRPLSNAWRVDGLPLSELKGLCLSVVGWVDDSGGPYVALQNSNQINILKDYECAE